MYVSLGVAVLVIKHVVAPDGPAAVSGSKRNLGMGEVETWVGQLCEKRRETPFERLNCEVNPEGRDQPRERPAEELIPSALFWIPLLPSFTTRLFLLS